MKLPWLAFIESNTSGTGRLFARAASQQGLRPVLLTADPARYPSAQSDYSRTVQLNTLDHQAVFDACRQLASEAHLAGVTSSSEYFIATAAAIASRLGLPGPRFDAVRACRNKRLQRIRLSAAGVAVPQSFAVRSIRGALAAARQIGFPVVVKPVSGTGSAGVKLCEDEQSVILQASRLLAQRENERGMPVPRQILIEQLAVGPEYSSETFGNRLIGITEKHLGPLPDFVEIGHDFPAALPMEMVGRISDVVTRALTALNLGWGPAQIELRLTEEGPKIIEVNPRLAGGYIPELVRLAYDINLISETIRLVAGQEPRLERAFSRHASLRFILPPADGLLTGVEGVAEAEALPGVAEVRLCCEVGAHLRRYGDFRDRVGHVMTTADTGAGARAIAEQAHGLIHLLVASGSRAAAKGE